MRCPYFERILVQSHRNTHPFWCPLLTTSLAKYHSNTRICIRFVGTRKSIDNFDCWTALGNVSFALQMKITNIVILSFKKLSWNAKVARHQSEVLGSLSLWMITYILLMMMTIELIVVSRVSWPSSVTYMYRTPIHEWCVLRCGYKNKYFWEMSLNKDCIMYA